jgi:hypothetical protein
VICQFLFADEPFSFSVCSNYDELREQLVVISKSFLVNAKVAEIDKMRENGNILVGDWLDYRVRKDVSLRLNALISSSKSQHAYFCQEFPATQVFHITHHVDLRMPSIDRADLALRIAYVGNPSNARFKDQFGESIEMIDAWDGKQVSWMYRLQNYNCHYAVRTSQKWDGFKPFTKGFIAAHCGAVIIVDEDDIEAGHYLGSEYPFRLKLRDATDLQRAIRFLSDSFRTPVWELALEIMKEVRKATGPRVLRMELQKLLRLAVA